MDVLDFVKTDSGSGSGDGSGDGSGSGYGYDSGDGYDSGYDDGSGYDDAILEINHQKVYMIDNIPTIITRSHGNVAKGFILQKSLNLAPCYIVKSNNFFAHGETLKEAFASLQEKLFKTSTVQERIDMFLADFEHNKKYKGNIFFDWHNKLTGSCLMGRNTFIKDNSLSLDKEYSVDEFIELTINSYGCDVMKELKKRWESEERK